MRTCTYPSSYDKEEKIVNVSAAVTIYILISWVQILRAILQPYFKSKFARQQKNIHPAANSFFLCKGILNILDRKM